MTIANTSMLTQLRRAGYRASLLCLTATLAACGGGGTSQDAGKGAPNMAGSIDAVALSAAQRALRDDILIDCGITDAPTSLAGGTGRLQFSPESLLTLHGRSVLTGKVAAIGTTEADAAAYSGAAVEKPILLNQLQHDALMLRTSMSDMRPFLTSNSGVVFVSAGSAQPSDSPTAQRMGVLMPNSLSDGATGCVAPVITPTSNTFNAAGNTVTTLLWRTTSLGGLLPIGGISGRPVDAFELIANFTPAAGATAFFAVRKTTLERPETAAVCRFASGAGSWTCERPRVRDVGERWILSVEQPRAGVFVLTTD